MRFLSVLAPAAAILLAAATAASASAAAPPAGSLYLQQATGGSLHGDSLVLRGVSPRTTAFSDRPVRTGGSITTRSFVGDWAAAFADNPPNAALEIAGAPASRDVALLELQAPRYDATAHTLTYRVKHLRTTRADGLRSLAARADSGVRDFGRATLFIDDGSAEQLLFFTATIPSGATISITPGNFTFDFNAALAGNSQIVATVQPTQLLEASFTTAFGASLFNLSFADGVANSLGVTVQTAVVAPAGETLTGTASVPSGAQLTANNGATTTPIPNGPFSLPMP